MKGRGRVGRREGGEERERGRGGEGEERGRRGGGRGGEGRGGRREHEETEIMINGSDFTRNYPEFLKGIKSCQFTKLSKCELETPPLSVTCRSTEGRHWVLLQFDT